MPWRSLARWGVRRTWKYNRYYADSATLAHAIHKKRMRKRAMQIFGGMEGISVRDTVRDALPVMIVGGTGQRVFPESDNPFHVIGKFIGEIVHTYNATWEWTGAIWRQRF